MVFDLRAQLGDRRMFGVGDEQDAMRIADRHGRRRQRRPSTVERKDFVSIGWAKRNVAPGEMRFADIDGHRSAARIGAEQAPPTVSMRTDRLVALLSISSRATQRAALPQDSTSPPSALKMRMNGVGALGGAQSRSPDRSRCPTGGPPPRARPRVERKPLIPRVEDDEIIAQTVHFAKGVMAAL
jgi:hypothetical protein